MTACMENQAAALRRDSIGFGEGIRPKLVRTDTAIRDALDGVAELGRHTLVAFHPVPDSAPAHPQKAGEFSLCTDKKDRAIDSFHTSEFTPIVVVGQQPLFEADSERIYNPDMGMGERIRQRLGELAQTQRWLADSIGSSQQTVQNLISRNSSSSRYLPQIAKALGVNELWLASGEGAMCRSSHPTGSEPGESHAPYLDVDALEHILTLIEKRRTDRSKSPLSIRTIAELISDIYPEYLEEQRRYQRSREEVDAAIQRAFDAGGEDEPTFSGSSGESRE